MIEKLKKDVENALEVFNEYQFTSKEGDVDRLESVLNDITTYFLKIDNTSELYRANKIISSMFNTMITKVSNSNEKKSIWDLLIRSLLNSLVDNEDIRLVFVNDYDLITTIAKSVHYYTQEEYNAESTLENLFKVLQILSIEGFKLSDEEIISDLLQFLVKCLVGRKNTNIRKLASRLITNICFTYPSYSGIVLDNPSYISKKKSLFDDVVFQIPSLMTSYMSFIIRFDTPVKQILTVNDNLLKILLFNFNALKTEEPYLRVYVGRFIEFLLFNETFQLTKLGEAWSNQKYAKNCIKEIFKILPIIYKSSEDLTVMYGFLYNISLNEEIRKLIYDLLIKQVRNENSYLFDSFVISEAFKVASDYTIPKRVPDEARINGGLFVYKMIEESVLRNDEVCCEEKKKDIMEYLKSLIATPVVNACEIPERIRVGRVVLFLKLCSLLSTDKSFIDFVPKLLTNKVASQLYELQTKYIPRIKLFLRHNSESLSSEIIRSIRLTPLLLKTLNAYEECRMSLNHLLSKPDVVEFLSVGLMSKDLELIEEVISSFEVPLQPPLKKQIGFCIRSFINIEKAHIESVPYSQNVVKQLKEQLEESFKLSESYKSEINILKDKIEELKENHHNVCLKQTEKYDDLKMKMEKIAFQNEQLASLKENMKNLLL